MGRRGHMKNIWAKFILSGVIVAALGLGSMIIPSADWPQDKTPRIFSLPELEKPRQICVENGRAYIVDQNGIVVYDINDGHLLKKIGKRGQGPGEFRSLVRLSMFPDRLVIRDQPIIKFFTIDGKYSGEIKEPGGIGFYPFLPVGENYFGFPMDFKDDGSLIPPAGRIYDNNFKLKNKFFGAFSPGPPPPPPPGSQPSGPKTDLSLIENYEDAIVQGDRIYVADSRKGLSISVFDKDGNSLYEIHHEIDKVKVPKDYLKNVIKAKKASNEWEIYYAKFNLAVPDYFPAFFGFKMDGDRIYVVTPALKGDLYEIIVMNLEGKILDKSFRFPIQPNYENPALFSLSYDIEKNQVVWYVYNDAKESYELHIR